MKTFLNIAIAFHCILFANVKGQSILVKSSLNTSVETMRNVTFDGDQIELNNISITCDSLIIKNKVKEIKVSGIVKIICKKLILESGPSPQDISLTKSSGLFQIEYSGKFIENNRKFIISNDEEFKLRFLKKRQY